MRCELVSDLACDRSFEISDRLMELTELEKTPENVVERIKLQEKNTRLLALTRFCVLLIKHGKKKFNFQYEQLVDLL